MQTYCQPCTNLPVFVSTIAYVHVVFAEGLKGGIPPGAGDAGRGAPAGFHYSGIDPQSAQHIFESLFGGSGGLFGGLGGFGNMGQSRAGGPSRVHDFSSGGPGGFGGMRMGGMPGGVFGNMFDGDEDMFEAGPHARTDPFEQFGMHPGHSRQWGAAPAPTPVQEVPLHVSLAELYCGTVKRLKVTRQVADAASGKTLPVQEMLEIDIKPGWKDGTRVTFQGKGDEKPGRPAADLVFVIKQDPHPSLERRGNDLYVTVHIPLITALAGGTVHVHMPDGHDVAIPVTDPVTPQTTRIIDGEGMPISKQPGRKGDLHVKFDIQFPRRLTAEQKTLVRQALGPVA